MLAWKQIQKYVLAYGVFALLVGALLFQSFQSRHHDQIEAESRLVQVTFQSVLKGFENNAELFYLNVIDRPENTRLMKAVYQASEPERAVLRQKLYASLIDNYRSMGDFKIKQLHFHLKNNDSFLRFHRPEKYGDNLSEVRSTVVYVNQHLQAISGFEEGRIFNGYRFVFPLFDGDEHVGSVETSVSMQVLIDQMQVELGEQAGFMIQSALVKQKVFSSETSNYRPTSFSSNFLYESSITPRDEGNLPDRLIQTLTLSKPLEKFLPVERERTYEVHDQGADYFLTFVPIKNAVSKQTVAYLMLAKENLKHQQFLKQFLVSLLAILVLGALIFWLFYQVKMNEKRLKQLQRETEHKNALLSKAQEVAQLGYWNLDLKSNQLYWSDEVYRMFGLKPQEFEATYEAFLKHVHPDDRDRLNQAYEQSLKDKEKYRITHRILKKNGEVGYVQEECRHELDEHGEIVRSIGTVLDISERVHNEQRLQSLKEQYQSLVQSVPEIVFRCEMDDDWTMLFVNDSIEKITGYPASDFISNRVRGFASIIHPQDLERVMASDDEQFEIEYRLLHRSGDIVYVKEHGQTVTLEEGHEVLEGIIADVTSEKQALQRLQQFIDTQSQIVIVRKGLELVYANKSLFKFFGYADLSDFNRHHQCMCEFFLPQEEFFHVEPNDGSDWVEGLLALPGSKRNVLMQNHAGKRHVFAVAVNAFDDTSTIITFNDISDTMREHIDWKYRASHDPLTGCLNRHFLEKNYQELVSEMTRSGKSAGLILFDVDFFKNINDTYGHNRGDQVLKALAKLVQSHIRDSDRLIRWGGEEFLLLFPVDSLDGVEAFASHLRSRIEQCPMASLALTCSFGGTLIEDSEKLKKAISRADEALYYVKENGRNGVKVQ